MHVAIPVAMELVIEFPLIFDVTNFVKSQKFMKFMALEKSALW